MPRKPEIGRKHFFSANFLQELFFGAIIAEIFVDAAPLRCDLKRGKSSI
jgi:hypothetical protein